MKASAPAKQEGVTDRVSLRQALDSITIPRIKKVVKPTWKTLVAMRTPDPCIALAGVNPHAGENGLFGTEEIEILRPAMYHDQGFGPMKTVDFALGVKGEADSESMISNWDLAV